jgi:hypothetical protein
MAFSPGMGQLFEQLRSNQTLREQFEQSPAQAVAPFELTPHERDAVVTRDCDDLVAIGLAPRQSALPSVLDCGGGPQIPQSVLDAIRDRLSTVLGPVRDVPGRLPNLPIPGLRPRPPRPEPRPGPDPPGPTPGPDPPKPDRPGPGGPGPGGPGD